MKMHCFDIFSISFLISILFPSLLCLDSEQDLYRLAEIVYSEPSEWPENTPQVPTVAPISQEAVRTTKLLDLGHLLKVTPKSMKAQNWKVYYRVAPKISSAHEQIPEIKELAETVLSLGEKFTSIQYSDGDAILGDLMSCLDTAHRVLKLDSLGFRQRLWAVGVYSCLKWSIPMQRKTITSKSFQHSYPFLCFRGNLEVFLLRDQPLGKIVEKVWEGPVADENLFDYAVIREAFRRASFADSVLRQLQLQKGPLTRFPGILSSFLHLKTPIDPTYASRFIKDVVHRLDEFDYLDPWKHSDFDEGKVLIQFLFYMHENHINSRETFLEITKACKLSGSVLESTIPFNFGGRVDRIPIKKLYKDMKERSDSIEELMPMWKVVAQNHLLIPLLSQMSLLP